MRNSRRIAFLALSCCVASACGGNDSSARATPASSDSALQAELRRAGADSALHVTSANADGAVSVPARVARAPITAPLPGAEAGCESDAASEQRRCLMAHLARSDAGLNTAYQSVIAEMKRQSPALSEGREPEVVRKLRAQEHAWLDYRDEQCRQRTRDKEGPLWAPVRAQCLAEFSAHREEQLLGALANMRKP